MHQLHDVPVDLKSEISEPSDLVQSDLELLVHREEAVCLYQSSHGSYGLGDRR